MSSMNHSIKAFAAVLVAASAAAIIYGCAGADRQQEQGIPWGTDVGAALQKAHTEKKIVMVDFMAQWCPPCRAMEDSTFSNPDVIAKASAFLPVRVDVDSQRTTAEEYGGNARKYGGIGIPNILFLDGEGRKLKHVVGYHGPEKLLAVMDSVLTGI